MRHKHPFWFFLFVVLAWSAFTCPVTQASEPVSADKASDDSLRPEWFRSKISGYAKGIILSGKTTGVSPESLVDPELTVLPERQELYNTRLRLNLETQYSEFVKSFISYDQEFAGGDLLTSGDWRFIEAADDRQQLLDGIGDVGNADKPRYHHNVYRAYVDIDPEPFELRIGRQQIPWGVSRFFTPSDAFNPVNATELEEDERRGVDAIFLRSRAVPALALRSFEIVMTPRRRSYPERWAFRSRHGSEAHHASVLGGTKNHDTFFGYDTEQKISQQLTFKSEGIHINPEVGKPYSSHTLTLAAANLPNHLYGLVEYTRNGIGKTDKAEYDQLGFINGDVFFFGRHYLSLNVGSPLSRRWFFEMDTVANLDDSSYALVPKIFFDISDKLFWSAKFYFFHGGDYSEFGTLGNIVYTDLKYKF